MIARFTVGVVFIGAMSTSCSTIGDACCLTCALGNAGAATVCPFYRPSGWCDTNASGDELIAFGEVKTTDKGPPPRILDPVAIARDPWELFSSTTLRAFSVARSDDGRIELPCTPGNDTPIGKGGLAWPRSRETDPPAWDPPERDAPNVTSCTRQQGAWTFSVVRQEQRIHGADDVVRYFIVTDYNY